ncbi:MAG: substrate-binding domain-containing protein [Lachnospiraceae bacterium]|nr:substrate-binding domain-containing protein [Lachnospiraceae bacterium]
MRRKTTLFCSAVLGAMLCGCGTNTTPEIIMPDQPMVSSVTTQQTSTTQTPAAADTSTQSAGSGSQYTVYLITMDLTDSYWKSIDDGCLSAASELGNVTYKWIGPDAHDDALQSACIDEAVSNGANAILIAANSADGVNASLQKAADSGCKIVYVDSAASYDCVTTLSTDNVAAGRTAGETMITALNEAGISNGTIGILGVTADTASCVARETGFRQAFEGTDFILADTVFMQDNADNVTNAVADGIAQNYVAFFGTNEGTSVAIGNAIKESGAESIIVGFDTSDAVLALVSEGIIYATMQQNPTVMGHDGMTIAIQALEGTYTDTNTTTDTGVTVITQDAM